MKAEIKPILNQGISPYLLKIYTPLIDKIVMEFEQSAAEDEQYPITSFLINKIQSITADFLNLKKIIKEAEAKILNAKSISEEQQIILGVCKALGATNQELAEDEKAFGRWFDFEAARERYFEKRGLRHSELHFLIERIPFVNEKDPRVLDFLIDISANFDGDNRINASALSALSSLIKNGATLKKAGLATVEKLIDLDNGDLKVVASGLEILSLSSPALFIDYFTKIFKLTKSKSKGEENQIFLKRSLVKLLDNIQDPAMISNAIASLEQDLTLPYVRQGLCKFLLHSNDVASYSILEKIVLNDKDKAVRGAALLALQERILTKEGSPLKLFELFAKIMLKEQDIFIIRLVLTITSDTINAITDGAIIKKLAAGGVTAITTAIITGDYPSSAKRWAADVNLLVWAKSEQKRLQIYARLKEIVSELPKGENRQIQDAEINDLSLEDLGKFLSLIAIDDFDLEFNEQDGVYVINRGVQMQFRLWRFLHEMVTSNPDKRQNYSHTLGRVYMRANLALSSMAELSETQTPGEPLFLPEEQGCRRFLPLLDYCLSIVNKGKEGQIFSSNGITTVTPPAALFTRIYASLVMTLKFKEIASLRNWQDGSFGNQSSYVNKLKEIGVKVAFKEYEGLQSNPDTKNYFGCLALFPFFAHYSFLDYFLSPHEESLISLLLFVLILIGLGSMHRIKSYRKQKQMRHKIPLVIGGWGTRGKTGTERLKVTIFNELGFKVVAKTTGCEPAIVVADHYGPAYEIPILRPHRFATINEQREITEFASLVETDVFLWECMALRSAYVDIIQGEWMVDDVSTITNAHPDHEDLQGPSGVDVANSIASFIRPGGHILTSEEQMLPIFQERAKKVHASLGYCSWIDIGLITDDILAQFSYFEHPANVALVSKLAKLVNVEENEAFAAMSKKVVPDVGALKAFLPCSIAGKTLQFINGMSANEELGCLGNWQRLGFDKFDSAANPGFFISNIVNNRADRGWRSRVFAELVSTKLWADCHFLIGTNLSGMKGYIQKSWNKHLKDLLKMMKSADAALLLAQTFKKLHVCIDEESKNRRIAAMKAYDSDVNSRSEVEKFAALITADHQNYLRLSQSVAQGNLPEAEIIKALTEIFMRKIVIIKEGDNHPDSILQTILAHTPPGYMHTLIGIQNIKTPGLDFVRAWQQWEVCAHLAEEIKSKDKKTQVRALGTLSKFEGFTILSKDFIKGVMADLKDPEVLKAASDYIEEINRDMDKIFGITHVEVPYSKWNIARNFWQVFLEIRRGMIEKKLSEKIYEDISKKRISISRAIKELSKFNL